VLDVLDGLDVVSLVHQAVLLLVVSTLR